MLGKPGQRPDLPVNDSSRQRALIAVFSTSELEQALASDALVRLGHVPVVFSRLEDLAKALIAGEAFDLVLAAFEGNFDAIRSSAKIVEQISHRASPVLLMVRANQLEASIGFSDFSTDFIVLPVNFEELRVRLAASLRRCAGLTHRIRSVQFKAYRFDCFRQHVHVGEKTFRLSKREFELALLLFRRAGVVQSREAIKRELWPKAPFTVISRTIDVHIARIRRKLDIARANSDVKILGVSGTGYVLLIDDESSRLRFDQDFSSA